MQNGVDNIEQIRAASGIEAIPAVVYVAASLPEPGRVRHGGRGDLVLADSLAEGAAVAKTFEPVGVPCRLTDNLAGEQWQKLIVNCAGNAVTALGRVGYGPAARNEYARLVMKEAAAECREVARAAGITLPQPGPHSTTVKDLEQYQPEVYILNRTRRRCPPPSTEIDSLNGYIARLGKNLSVPTPVNRTLHALVKLLEQSL